VEAGLGSQLYQGSFHADQGCESRRYSTLTALHPVT